MGFLQEIRSSFARARGQSGVTLVEGLIGLMIVALAAATALQVSGGVRRAGLRAESVLGASQQRSLLLQRLGDLSNPMTCAQMLQDQVGNPLLVPSVAFPMADLNVYIRDSVNGIRTDLLVDNQQIHNVLYNVRLTGFRRMYNRVIREKPAYLPVNTPVTSYNRIAASLVISGRPNHGKTLGQPNVGPESNLSDARRFSYAIPIVLDVAGAGGGFVVGCTTNFKNLGEFLTSQSTSGFNRTTGATGAAGAPVYNLAAASAYPKTARECLSAGGVPFPTNQGAVCMIQNPYDPNTKQDLFFKTPWGTNARTQGNICSWLSAPTNPNPIVRPAWNYSGHTTLEAIEGYPASDCSEPNIGYTGGALFANRYPNPVTRSTSSDNNSEEVWGRVRAVDGKVQGFDAGAAVGVFGTSYGSLGLALGIAFPFWSFVASFVFGVLFGFLKGKGCSDDDVWFPPRITAIGCY